MVGFVLIPGVCVLISRLTSVSACFLRGPRSDRTLRVRPLAKLVSTRSVSSRGLTRCSGVNKPMDLVAYFKYLFLTGVHEVTEPSDTSTPTGRACVEPPRCQTSPIYSGTSALSSTKGQTCSGKVRFRTNARHKHHHYVSPEVNLNSDFSFKLI